MVYAIQTGPRRVVVDRRKVILREGHERACDLLIQLASLKTDEEVKFVLEDRSAERSAPLFLSVLRWSEIVHAREVVFRRPVWTAEIAKRRARKTIRSRFRDDVHHGAKRTAPFGFELIGHQLDFLDGF